MKRYIKASEEMESNLSFDFSYKGDTYDRYAVESIAEDALEPYECVGFDFVPMTEWYTGYNTKYPNISQCNVTFIHDDYSNAGDYKRASDFIKQVERKLQIGLVELGVSLEGMDIHSID